MTLTCPYCDRPSSRPIRDALSHFKPYESGYWKYLRGNIKAFGFWGGLNGTLGLAFPIYNTLSNWKYRKDELALPGGESLALTVPTERKDA